MEKNLQSVRPTALTDEELAEYGDLVDSPTPEWLMEVNKRFFDRRRALLLEASHTSAQQLAFDFSVTQ